MAFVLWEPLVNHLVLVLSVPGEHGGVEQESRVKSTPRTHVSMVLCLTLRETAITQLNTGQPGQPHCGHRVPRVLQ